jgi:hypothetical protein
VLLLLLAADEAFVASSNKSTAAVDISVVEVFIS